MKGREERKENEGRKEGQKDGRGYFTSRDDDFTSMCLRKL
jgi:hypothetical protein